MNEIRVSTFYGRQCRKTGNPIDMGYGYFPIAFNWTSYWHGNGECGDVINGERKMFRMQMVAFVRFTAETLQ